MNTRALVIPITVLVAILSVNVEAMPIWLSGSDAIPGGTFAGEAPLLIAAPGSTGNAVNVWARPDAGKTLRNWSLDLRSTNPGVLDFTSATVYNPQVGSIPSPPSSLDRWEFTTNGTIVAPAADRIDNLSGFTITVGDLGIGPATSTATNPPFSELDPLYDSVGDVWLLATVFYDILGTGTTDLFLQIGANGINNDGGVSADIGVVFGALTDPALNGNTGRQIDSLTADATITVRGGPIVPVPAAVWLFGSGLLGLLGFVKNALPMLRKSLYRP